MGTPRTTSAGLDSLVHRFQGANFKGFYLKKSGNLCVQTVILDTESGIRIVISYIGEMRSNGYGGETDIREIERRCGRCRHS